MKQLTPAAKAVLRVISLSWFASSLAGIFVDLFIFKQTNQFKSLVVYNGFLFLFLLAGAIYGLIWSFFLSMKNFKKFKKEFYEQFVESKSLFVLMSSIGFVFIAAF